MLKDRKVITIVVEGGIVQDVLGLPDGMVYQVDDHDDDEEIPEGKTRSWFCHIANEEVVQEWDGEEWTCRHNHNNYKK